MTTWARWVCVAVLAAGTARQLLMEPTVMVLVVSLYVLSVGPPVAAVGMSKLMCASCTAREVRAPGRNRAPAAAATARIAAAARMGMRRLIFRPRGRIGAGGECWGRSRALRARGLNAPGSINVIAAARSARITGA